MTHYITKEGLAELKEELEDLKERRSEIAQRIKEAKELGDLSENADYTDAKEAQSFNEGRIAELKDILENAEIITKTSGDTVEIGSTVVVTSDRGEQTFTLVGASETSPAAGKISNESPIGKALLGKKRGEEASVETPSGTTTYTIKKIQ